jgi:hypothetical protein
MLTVLVLTFMKVKGLKESLKDPILIEFAQGGSIMPGKLLVNVRRKNKDLEKLVGEEL